jgi:hypothetical protein
MNISSGGLIILLKIVHYRRKSIILPPIPNITPISPKAIIIPTNHVAEGEPIPPLPL